MARRMLFKTKAKRWVARKTGIPTTRSGRRTKLRRIATGGGCLVYVLGALLLATSAIWLIVSLL